MERWLDLAPRESTAEEVARHLAGLASLTTDLPAGATAISTTVLANPALAETIVRLAPALGARYDLITSVERGHGSVTVRFARRKAMSAPRG